MSETPRLNFPYIVSSHILDALVQPVVEGVLVNVPPVKPVAGMLYIVGSSPSGVWSGKAACLTQYIGETWAFYIPFEGLSVWNKATKTQWSFTGNQWSETKVEQHMKRNDNPHGVTAAQVGAETPTGAQAKVDIHINKAASAHSANAISVVSTGNIGATNVQAALTELDVEKLDVSDVVATPIANKIVRLNSNAKLPASITGDADTIDGYHAASFVKTTDAVDAAKLNGQPGTYYSATSHTHSAATAATSGFLSTADKQKLDNLVAGTQQNTFGTIKVGDTNVEADAPNDVLELVAGTNITLTPDSTNDRVTIGLTGTVPTAASAGTCTGNAATATTLAAARTIGISGDATGGATSFNGGANITIPLTLANSGVAAGTYTSITVDAKGRVIAGTNPTTISASTTGNASTATTLATARTITLAGNVSGSATFNGSSNVTITTTVADNSHNHTIANINGLQSILEVGNPFEFVSKSAVAAATSKFTITGMDFVNYDYRITLDAIGSPYTAVGGYYIFAYPNGVGKTETSTDPGYISTSARGAGWDTNCRMGLFYNGSYPASVRDRQRKTIDVFLTPENYVTMTGDGWDNYYGISHYFYITNAAVTPSDLTGITFYTTNGAGNAALMTGIPAGLVYNVYRKKRY